MNQDSTVKRELENDEITIDFTELFFAVWNKIHIVILAGILMTLLAFVGTKVFITPLYSSTTKMYVLSKQDGNAGVTLNDIQTGTQLTKDYMELVKSRPVLDQVIAVLNLDMTVEELQASVVAETPVDTRILSITVKNKEPKIAKDIADALRESVGIHIKEIMDADSVNTFEEGNLPTAPSSPSLMKNMMIGGLLGILIALGIIVLVFILDDTVKTPDDVEHYLGLNVLTSIPIQEGMKKSKKVKGMSAKKFIRKMRR